ncbi:hypothetical protein FGIG_08720 [Fasciola gigantica]|uniref:Uncharacterized protein n=1 Tax=Fasciola gigantica TaxID=46835 RepID=A0A504YDS1_FASGI|nr:hypothetical protein FGIG_08720 [Fasciola gigantica]
MIIKVLGSRYIANLSIGLFLRDKSEEWILLELQGELVSKSVEVLSGQLIGDLHFSTQASSVPKS